MVKYKRAIIIIIILTIAITAMWDNCLCVVIVKPLLQVLHRLVSIATTDSLSYLSTVVSPMRTELQ